MDIIRGLMGILKTHREARELIRSGLIYINGVLATVDTPLCLGDKIEVRVTPHKGFIYEKETLEKFNKRIADS